MSDSVRSIFGVSGDSPQIFSSGSIERVSSDLTTTTLSLDIGRVLKPGNSWREGVEERDWCVEAQHEGGRDMLLDIWVGRGDDAAAAAAAADAAAADDDDDDDDDDDGDIYKCIHMYTLYTTQIAVYFETEFM